jgi:hypothetical protein
MTPERQAPQFRCPVATDRLADASQAAVPRLRRRGKDRAGFPNAKR